MCSVFAPFSLAYRWSSLTSLIIICSVVLDKCLLKSNICSQILIEIAQEDPVISNLKLYFYLLTKWHSDTLIKSVSSQRRIAFSPGNSWQVRQNSQERMSEVSGWVLTLDEEAAWLLDDSFHNSSRLPRVKRACSRRHSSTSDNPPRWTCWTRELHGGWCWVGQRLCVRWEGLAAEGCQNSISKLL